ncbi:hypothetical protein R9C00_25125 [Flammeovirgaceae bacterium SG7u.111]|nr:hypothetical protein [Flammeovirgaceae bacterium SG7u.132]WPO34980.1 hypothetical protein R9C00_25125 [Flammeovirgaceae bacterium SG7u.111]
MIIGFQRSGTNALFDSLSYDNEIRVYNESDKYVMKKWLLRPEKKIRNILCRDKKILLKPITESYIRNTGDLLEEYKKYNITLVFIFRDPINVYYSNMLHDSYYHEVDNFIHLYKKRMKNIMEGFPTDKEKGIIVKYEDLISDKTLFDSLCTSLKIKGNFIFKPDSNKGYKNLSKEIIEKINNTTNETYSQINNLYAEYRKETENA